MYKIASKKAQASASRISLAEGQTGEVREPTDEERRENLSRQRKLLAAKLEAIKAAGKTAANKALRKELGRQLQALDSAMCAIRPKSKLKKEAREYFWHVVAEHVTPAQFKLWAEEAIRRMEADHQRDESPSQRTL